MLEKGDLLLRPSREEDLDGMWYRWFNNKEITKYQNKGIFPNTREKQKEYMMQMQKSTTDVLFAIVKKDIDFHIGCVGIHNIDWLHRSGMIGIIIGDKSYWNRGYGKLAWNMITQYGFFTLNLHRLWANIFKENEASIKVAQASGFKIEGTVRHMYYKNGKWHDAVLVGLLKDEFKEVKL